MPRLQLLAVLIVAACGNVSEQRADSAAAGSARAADSVTARKGVPKPAGIVRGIYVNRFAAQSPRRMQKLIAMADSTEINAFVIDIKDEFGLNYATRDSIAKRNAGNAGVIPNLKAMLDTLEAHGIISIARIVVFKDSVAARVNPQHTIRRADGTPWRDKEGLTWVSAYDDRIWEYNIRVAEEMARMGFDEIQFDYIRFPEPYKSLPAQVFPTARGRSKPQALGEFLAAACPRIRKLGALCTVDIFGLVTSVKGALEIGQQWESLSKAVDVMLPMTYPSHYPRGSFGVARPNADPYAIQYAAIKRARERDTKAGITEPEHVRPWIQAFSLGQPKYGPAEIIAQKRGIYDAGYDGWVLWHPGSIYEPYFAGLEKTLESRKSLPGAAPAGAPRGAPASVKKAKVDSPAAKADSTAVKVDSAAATPNSATPGE